jgi:uncharacterized protein (DUF849 family)
VLLKGALNGTRTRAEHPAIPMSPEELAREAKAAVAEGAGAIHVHVRDAAGHESLAPRDVARTLEAIREACPGISVGVSTGAWIVPNLEQRLALIRAWEVLPDFASVNLHETGAGEVFRLLADKRLGAEAGIWNTAAARFLLDRKLVDQCLRIMIEPAEEPGDARANFERIQMTLDQVDRARLVHGSGDSAWEFLFLAARQGYEVRIGFEDTLTLPDGRPADSNADLVAAAKRMIAEG